MKLEFLDDISNDGQFKDVLTDKLVRLYDFDQKEANQFREIIKKTIIEERKALDLLTINFIKPINCKLTFRLSEKDIGLITEDNKTFYCDLTTSAFENMISLIAPFAFKDENSYQWLYNLDNEIELLFSKNGQW